MAYGLVSADGTDSKNSIICIRQRGSILLALVLVLHAVCGALQLLFLIVGDVPIYLLASFSKTDPG